MNLLITSRKEQDIAAELESNIDIVQCIQSEKVNADVELYVQECLDKDPTLKRCRPIREEVMTSLVKGAHGMYSLQFYLLMCSRFRWVVCQLDALRKCLTTGHIKKALQQLPKTLDDTYNRILDQIDDEYCQFAYDIFTLTSFLKTSSETRRGSGSHRFQSRDKMLRRR